MILLECEANGCSVGARNRRSPVAGCVKLEKPGVTIRGRNCHIPRENEGPTRTEAKKTPFRRDSAVVTIHRLAKKAEKNGRISCPRETDAARKSRRNQLAIATAVNQARNNRMSQEKLKTTRGQREPIDRRIDGIGFPQNFAQQRNPATFEFAAVGREAAVVEIGRGGMIENDAGDGQAAVESPRGVKREQRVVDRAEGVLRHDHERKTKVVGEIGERFVIVDGGQKAAGAFDEQDVASLAPVVQAVAQELTVDLAAFRPSGKMRRKRSLETLWANAIEHAETTGGLP
jgi:hypothetical protein